MASVFVHQCDEAELKGRPPLGVQNRYAPTQSEQGAGGPRGRQCTVHSAHHLEPIMTKQPRETGWAFSRYVKRHLFCRKEDTGDAAEDGESRSVARSEKGLRI